VLPSAKAPIDVTVTPVEAMKRPSAKAATIPSDVGSLSPGQLHAVPPEETIDRAVLIVGRVPENAPAGRKEPVPDINAAGAAAEPFDHTGIDLNRAKRLNPKQVVDRRMEAAGTVQPVGVIADEQTAARLDKGEHAVERQRALLRQISGRAQIHQRLIEVRGDLDRGQQGHRRSSLVKRRITETIVFGQGKVVVSGRVVGFDAGLGCVDPIRQRRVAVMIAFEPATRSAERQVGRAKGEIVSHDHIVPMVKPSRRAGIRNGGWAPQPRAVAANGSVRRQSDSGRRRRSLAAPRPIAAALRQA